MKKFLSSFTFIFKAMLLVLLLVLGWVFINVTNLIKGKKLSEKESLSKSMFGADEATADAPGGGGGGEGGGGFFACPHVAYFDGEAFKIENDFLCESLRYFPLGLGKYSLPFKDKFLRPDLLKFTHAPKTKDGDITLQFQENEEEESFIKWFKLIRVIHPQGSEVLVNSDFNSFDVLDSSSANQNVMTPSLVTLNGTSDVTPLFSNKKYLWENPNPETDTPFEKNAVLEFTFRDLKIGDTPRFIIKSVFRDYMVGEESRLISAQWPLSLAKSLAILAGGLYFLLEQKSLSSALAFFPVVFGVQGKSIHLSYEDAFGNFKLATIHKPRAWNYGAEVVPLPSEAVKEDGTLRLRAEFTKRHKLAFAGVIQNDLSLAHREKELALASAVSSRSGDIMETLLKGRNYTQMVPGDKIDLVFKNPAVAMGANEKETYLLKTFGYYTALSKKGKALAGNWREKISEEARSKLASLKSLNN